VPVNLNNVFDSQRFKPSKLGRESITPQYGIWDMFNARLAYPQVGGVDELADLGRDWIDRRNTKVPKLSPASAKVKYGITVDHDVSDENGYLDAS